MVSPQKYLNWLNKILLDRSNAVSLEKRNSTSTIANILLGIYKEALDNVSNVECSSTEAAIIDSVLDTFSEYANSTSTQAKQQIQDDSFNIIEMLSQCILDTGEHIQAMAHAGAGAGGGDNGKDGRGGCFDGGLGSPIGGFPGDHTPDPIGNAGKNTILVIDTPTEHKNPLIQSLRCAQVSATERSYGIIYFPRIVPEGGSCEEDGTCNRNDKGDIEEDENLEKLENFLKLKQPDKPDTGSSEAENITLWGQLCEEYNRYHYLRAVIIGPHLISPNNGEVNCDEWKKIVRIVRDIYPNMPIFIIAHERLCGQNIDNLQTKVCEFMKTFFLDGAPTIFESREIFGIEGETLFKKLDKISDNYFHAPFWEGLKSLADSPVVSFHALPVGSRRSQSPSLKDFIKFYGVNIFRAETSLAGGPLDSLLKPSGSLKLAQDKAAVTFGVRTGARPSEVATCIHGTRFVTNGTTTANKIVLGAHVRPQEYVLIDRNCHISHHYALAHCHAHPVYLQPFHNEFGISGPIPLETIEKRFEDLFEDKNVLPAAIVLTNPTFDGIFYKPRKIIESVRNVLWKFCEDSGKKRRLRNYIKRCHPKGKNSEHDLRCNKKIVQSAFECIIFLFDEAWAAYAYLHPQTIDCTAMKAGLDIKRAERIEHEIELERIKSEGKKGKRKKSRTSVPICKEDCDEINCDNLEKFPIVESLRVYSTQSTHKSLSALRQGSMIHFRDPMMKHGAVKEAFDQSYRSNTSTSPNATILASLDVTRRQAQIEGTELVERAILLSKSFRRAIGEASSVADINKQAFSIISNEGMLKNHQKENMSLSENNYFIDPTRVTIGYRRKVSGHKIKKRLLDRDIQVNKYNNLSVLGIFNIGVSISAKNSFIRALHSIEDDIEHQNHSSDDAVEFEGPLAEIDGLLCTAGGKDLGYWLQNVGRHKREIVKLKVNKKSKKTYKLYYEDEEQGSNSKKIEWKESYWEIEGYPSETEEEKRQLVSANFVVPYPPGFPVLVPGQIIRNDDLKYLAELENNEIHGTKKDEENGNLLLSVYFLPPLLKKMKKKQSSKKTTPRSKNRQTSKPDKK